MAAAMYGWSFPAHDVESFSRLCRALARHRYLRSVEHSVHVLVDRALAPLSQAHRERAERFKAVLNEDPALELGSRDPRLWRAADVDELLGTLAFFWTPATQARAAESLLQTLEQADVPLAQHAPFASPPDEPPHPELIMLDWTFRAVDELDSEQHAGALRAMADSGDEAEASEPVYVEGPTLSSSELCAGAPGGELVTAPVFWADGPYSYVDYVFRGVRRGAKLEARLLGYRDIDSL